MIKFKRTGLAPIGWILPVAGWMVISVACNNGPDQNQTEPDRILLQQPPFAALTDSIRQFPKDATLYFRRADLLSRNNQHEIAASDFKTAWGLQPDEETGLRYATTLSILNKPSEAIAVLQECVQKFPTDGDFKKLEGEIYTQSGNTTEALKLYEGILKADSTDFEAWYEKGLLLEQTKDTAGAISALQRALSIQPITTYAMELAHMYAETMNKKALQLCDETLQKDSTHQLTDPFFIKGIYYSNLRQYNTAITQFDSCIHRDWKFMDAYIEKGIAFFKQKKFEEARKVFEMAVTVSNSYPDSYFWIGRCYEATGKKDEAVPFYERAIGLDKKFVEAREALQRVKGG